MPKSPSFSSFHDTMEKSKSEFSSPQTPKRLRSVDFLNYYIVSNVLSTGQQPTPFQMLTTAGVKPGKRPQSEAMPTEWHPAKHLAPREAGPSST